MQPLGQVVIQREEVLRAVAEGRTAVSTEALELSGRGSRDDGIGLLRLGVLEYSDALEHETSGPATEAPNDPLEADERGRAVAAVHHQVLDLPFPLEIAGEGLQDGGPSESWLVLALAVGLFIPGLDGEPSIRALHHVPTSEY